MLATAALVMAMFGPARPAKDTVSFVTLLSLIYSVVLCTPANALTVDWSFNNPNIVTGPTTISQIVDVLTITAQAFTTEIDGASSIIFGPFPTTPGIGQLQVFGRNTSGA
jgi:hypothetical protein